MSTMYPSIQLKWSESPSEAEMTYRKAGMVRTQGTLFMLPPDLDVLISTYTAPPRPKTMMSSGATALCKHFERGGASSERGRAHPFWPLPKGSNDNKNRMAAEVLEDMLKHTTWKNVMMLHQGVAVYEIRNCLGFGMRWTLQIEQQEGQSQEELSPNGNQLNREQSDLAAESYDRLWKITEIKFRGFLEPIEGLDHELPMTNSTNPSKE